MFENKGRIQLPDIGGAGRDRTDDLKLAKLALSQLSYGPKPAAAPELDSRRRTGGPGKI